jgi:hypothetical protein
MRKHHRPLNYQGTLWSLHAPHLTSEQRRASSHYHAPMARAVRRHQKSGSKEGALQFPASRPFPLSGRLAQVEPSIPRVAQRETGFDFYLVMRKHAACTHPARWV